MAGKSSIEWTDATWNFIRGCSRVSEGCRNCYAEGIAARFSGKGMAYEGLAEFVNHKPRWTGEISFHEDILLEPLRWKKPQKIFVNSMSDLFHEKVTDEMLDRAFAVMALTPQHTYQILTKRPERMKKFVTNAKWERLRNWMNRGPNGEQVDFGNLSTMAHRSVKGSKWEFFNVKNWPLPNVWLGVSVEDQKTADERIPMLLQTPAAVRWISAEPLLGSIDLGRRSAGSGWDEWLWSGEPKIDWVVVGGESGPKARPMYPAWARSIKDRCVEADIPFFFKQWGEWGIGGSGAILIGNDGPCPHDTYSMCTERDPEHLHTLMSWQGKKAAGRLLDGQEWNQYPLVAAAKPGAGLLASKAN
jgi:protein gp37